MERLGLTSPLGVDMWIDVCLNFLGVSLMYVACMISLELFYYIQSIVDLFLLQVSLFSWIMKTSHCLSNYKYLISVIV